MNYTRAYSTLLSFYPKDYQFRFAAEMTAAFEIAVREHVCSRRNELRRFIAGEFKGLLLGAGAEWIAKWTTDVSLRSRFLPDLRMMRRPWVPREDRHRVLERRTCSPDISQ